MNLSDHINKLPYIIIHPQKLLCLIDTGSTGSFMRPDIAKKHYNENIFSDRFMIKTPHGVTYENFNVNVPAPNEFKPHPDT